MTATQLSLNFSEAEAHDRTKGLISAKLDRTKEGSPKADLLNQILDEMKGPDKVKAYGRTVALINKLMGGSRYGSPRFNTLQLLLDWLEANEL